MRIFIAIAIPHEQRSALARHCSGIPRASWVDEEDLHCTLRFMGEMSDDGVAALQTALRTVHVEPFDMHIEGVGTFPPLHEQAPPTVLWAGVKASQYLTHIQHQVEQIAQQCGAAPEHRPFHAHVTLARLRATSTTDLTMWTTLRASLALPPFSVTRIDVYESVLDSEGGHYRLL
jgi:2'-5' RNA ligase